MKLNYPLYIDEANSIVYAWFKRMQYKGGTVTSDLEPKLILFEDIYYDIYQKVGNEIFVDLFSKMHSNIRQFFPLDEIQNREIYLWFENDELVGSIRIHHNTE
ncbi:MAG: hypothetical protein Q8909_18920, partial [Bacteroidota bacterium]|nr:hypothetical protein [Bacteroidota bacterium]